MIALVDYGAGNLGSVLKAIRCLGHEARPADRPELLQSATKIILPGQGHFGQMLTALADRHLLRPLKSLLAAGKPYLGICLGLQALYESSEEAPDVPGLGFLPGRVARFRLEKKVPQVGWNQLQIRSSDDLLKGVPEGSFVYYCHSYYGPVTNESVAVSEYGEPYAAAVKARNLCAVQFHPEKSAQVGLRVLKNFLDDQCRG